MKKERGYKRIVLLWKANPIGRLRYLIVGRNSYHKKALIIRLTVRRLS